jgi:S-adenosylmethionine synthetase
LAIAFIDRHVDSVAHYFRIKQAMHEALTERLTLPARLCINTLDDPRARDESGLYLTVTGLSAEMGDDGQVGRGNRVNGLITPGRPMSLEAAAGKNPVSHVGKLYNVLALLVAREIHAQVAGAQEVHVQLLSAIGDPVDQPQLASIDIASRSELTAAARDHAADIADKWLSDIGHVTAMILDERIAVC